MQLVIWIVRRRERGRERGREREVEGERRREGETATAKRQDKQ